MLLLQVISNTIVKFRDIYISDEMAHKRKYDNIPLFRVYSSWKKNNYTRD